ncbi:MBL fold metallo-hydrolase [Halorubrum trueperi]
MNAYLIDDRGTLTLVDAGMPWDAPRLKEGLACIGATVSDVDRVLVTHYQFERIAGFLPMQMPSREQGAGVYARGGVARRRCRVWETVLPIYNRL